MIRRFVGGNHDAQNSKSQSTLAFNGKQKKLKQEPQQSSPDTENDVATGANAQDETKTTSNASPAAQNGKHEGESKGFGTEKTKRPSTDTVSEEEDEIILASGPMIADSDFKGKAREHSLSEDKLVDI